MSDTVTTDGNARLPVPLIDNLIHEYWFNTTIRPTGLSNAKGAFSDIKNVPTKRIPDGRVPCDSVF